MMLAMTLLPGLLAQRLPVTVSPVPPGAVPFTLAEPLVQGPVAAEGEPAAGAAPAGDAPTSCALPVEDLDSEDVGAEDEGEEVPGLCPDGPPMLLAQPAPAPPGGSVVDPDAAAPASTAPVLPSITATPPPAPDTALPSEKSPLVSTPSAEDPRPVEAPAPAESSPGKPPPELRPVSGKKVLAPVPPVDAIDRPIPAETPVPDPAPLPPDRPAPPAAADALVAEPPRRAAEAAVQAALDRLPAPLDEAAEDRSRVHVTLHREGEDWRVVVSAENPETLDLMRRHADQLQQELAQQGLGDARLDFSDWSEPPDPEAEEAEAAAPEAAPAPLRYTHQPFIPASGLDLRL